MRVRFLDLYAQYSTIKEEIDNAIKRVIKNTSFIGGEEVANFKFKFEQLYGVKHCVPLANGTDALYISLKMLDIGPGDEVITTASSWISTSETISQAGARPVFVDIDEFYTLDVSLIEERINENTKAIIPVHLYGQMCDMPAIMKLAKKYNLKVIEDCAQAHFSELNGIRAGLWGDAGTFSFYPGKNLGAFGDAGCLVTNSDELAEKCRVYANHGAPVKHHHIMEGINSRLDGLQAAILNVKLDSIMRWTELREEVGGYYLELLKKADSGALGIPKVRVNSRHSFHVFPVHVENRDNVKEILKAAGIDTQVHYPKALPFMPAYSYMKAQPDDFPNAFKNQNLELSLPIYPELSKEKLDYTVDRLLSAL